MVFFLFEWFSKLETGAFILEIHIINRMINETGMLKPVPLCPIKEPVFYISGHSNYT
jgi:hypothetical protein